MNPYNGPWVNCPLKQEIRVALWEPYVRELTGGKALRTYLTLYDEYIVDIKLFADKKLVEFDGELYRGAVGITWDAAAFAKVVRHGEGRLELLLKGDIADILTGRASLPLKDRKKFAEAFPFDAVNLDYTGSIYAKDNRRLISSSLEALDTLFKKQSRKGCQQFCLFLTTRAEAGQLASELLSVLEAKNNENISSSHEYKEAFLRAYEADTATNLRGSSYEDFATIGLLKLVVSMLSDHKYEATRCDAVWLVRDIKPPKEGLIHLAFLIKKAEEQSPGLATRARQFGRRQLQYRLGCLIDYMNRRAASDLGILKESIDRDALQVKHGADITKLTGRSYEFKKPGPQ